MRWTVDTIDDFKLMEKLLTSVKDDPLCHWSKILKNIQANPAWLTLNEHVEQKHG